MSDEKEKRGFSGLSSLASDIEEVAAGTPRPKDQSERRAIPASESSDAEGSFLDVVKFFFYMFLYMFLVYFVLGMLGVLISLFEDGYWFVGLVVFGALTWLFKDIFKDR